MVHMLDRLFPYLACIIAASLFLCSMYGSYLFMAGRRKRATRVVISCILFNIPFFAVFHAVEYAGRREVAAAVNIVRDGKGYLSIDGIRIKEPEPYLRAFVKWFPARSHTTPIPPSILMVLDGVSVRVARDSTYKDEYWVFYPKYRTTAENDIGRIHSESLRPWFEDKEESERRP